MNNNTKAPQMAEGFTIRMTTQEARAVVAVLKAYRGYKCREEAARAVASIIDRQICKECEG